MNNEQRKLCDWNDVSRTQKCLFFQRNWLVTGAKLRY